MSSKITPMSFKKILTNRVVLMLMTGILVGLIASCDLLSPPADQSPNQPGSPAPNEPGPIEGAEKFLIMPGPYFPFAQIENVVTDELGENYTIADWHDFESQSAQLERFLDAVGIEQGESYFVFWNGRAHPDKVAASGVSAQHPGPAAFRYLAYRGSQSELNTHFEDLVIIDDSFDPQLVLYRSWNEPGNILVVQR